MLLGSFGAKALVSATVARIANRLSPELLTRSWRRRIDRHKPGWLAPDPDLARQLFESADRTRPSWPADGFYLRELRRGLRHPLLAWEMEEFGAMGARQGLRVAHPFFDADLVDFLCRVHPDRLLDGGSPNKSLIRRRLSNTFPELGFGAQKKFDATRYFAELVQREAPALWSSLGGATALADLGVVEPRALESEVDTILSSGLAKPRTYYRVWDVLNLETWLRSHS